MRPLRKLLVSALVLGVVGSLIGAATWAAFSHTTANSGNTFAAGTVSLSDNDANGTLLSLSNATPGSSSTGCIKVTYVGSLDASVRLYATASGNLAQYLTLTVTRGTQSAPSFPACSSFSADSRDYIGSGAGVVYSGSLSSYPGTYAAGLVDKENASGSTETWSSSEEHSYKFTVTLADNSAAQGQSASASFSWEARNQ